MSRNIKASAANSDGEAMRPTDIARRLGISTRAVQRLLRQKKLPGLKLGRLWLVDKDVLDSFLTQLRQRCVGTEED